MLCIIRAHTQFYLVGDLERGEKNEWILLALASKCDQYMYIRYNIRNSRNEQWMAVSTKKYCMRTRTIARTTHSNVCNNVLLLLKSYECLQRKQIIIYSIYGINVVCIYVLCGRGKPVCVSVRGREKYKIYELHTIFSISQIHTHWIGLQKTHCLHAVLCVLELECVFCRWYWT